MTYRVGVDLVDVAEVEAALATHGSAYVQRVYTPGEQAVCTSTSGEYDPALLAQRFAAKEAVRKAVRPDLRWTDIEVDTAVPPGVSVPDVGWSLFLSLTEASGRAAAVVVGEKAIVGDKP